MNGVKIEKKMQMPNCWVILIFPSLPKDQERTETDSIHNELYPKHLWIRNVVR